MKRSFLLVTVSILVMAATAAGAQDRTAKLVGYERAELVRGEVTLAETTGMVMVGALQNAYSKPLGLFLARGFDLANGVKVGEIPAELSGGMTFDAPEGMPEGVDTVVLTIQDWSVPVAVGLLK